LDVSADLTALNIEVAPERGRLTLTLRNDHGRYTSPGSGDLAVWTPGAQVEVGLGYRISAGVETVLLPHFWLDGWEHLYGNGAASVVISASGQYLLQRRPIQFRSVTSLAEELRLAGTGMKDPVVVINADNNATHQSVIRVMDAARQAGFGQIVFAVEQVTK